MIKDVIGKVSGYCEGMKQSMEVRKQAEDFIKANYLPDSVVFNEAMKSCAATFDEAVTPLKKSYSEAVEKEITEAKQRIAEVVGADVPDELMKVLPMVNGMSDFEKSAILKKYDNNYSASRLLNQAMGNQDFRTVEHLIEDLDGLRTQLDKVPHSALDSYNTALMLNDRNDGWVNRVSDEVQNFIDTYTMKGGE